MSKTSKPRVIAVTAASTVALGASGSRERIIMSAPVTGRYSVAVGEDAVLDGGITVHTVSLPVVIDRSTVGDLIVLPITVIGSGAFNVGWLEISGP
jgi:hypothetical protein